MLAVAYNRTTREIESIYIYVCNLVSVTSDIQPFCHEMIETT